MVKVVVITPPTEEPVSLVEAKAWLRVDQDAENATISQLVSAARAWCEQESGRAFVTRTLKAFFDAFPADGEPLRLPMPRLLALAATGLHYFGTDGTEQNPDNTKWQIDDAAEPAELWPLVNETWPAVQTGRINPVTVQYTAGYGAASAVDPRAKQAILVLVAHWYENREASLTGTISKEIELGLRALLDQLWHGRLS